MVSHAIAHLTNRDFVSLHRDSESAQNHCPVGEKYLPNWENKKGLKKEKDGAQENKTTTTILSWQGFLKETRVMKQDSKPRNESFR